MEKTITTTDQLGRQVSIPFPPGRIVSLVPSQTELLADLGLDESVAGITKFCVRPPGWRKQKVIVGGTKNVHIDRIDALKPDLIIANKEENEASTIEALAKEYPVWVSDVITVDDALDMIENIGIITGRKSAAMELTGSIRKGFRDMKKLPPMKSAYFIWRNPWMVAGGDTFIHHMMELSGLRNAFSNYPRYPEVDIALLKQAAPEVLLLSSEPFPFKEKHADELRQILPEAKIIFVDGQMFSWYGSRMRYFPEYIRQLGDVVFMNMEA